MDPVEVEATQPTTLPHDSAARRAIPLTQGVLQYFPAALAEVAKVSKMGAIKHSAGVLSWTRPDWPRHHEVLDHLDCVLRHIVDYGENSGDDDESGLCALAHAAWRMLAACQIELELRGAPIATNAVPPPPSAPEAPTTREDF